MGQFSKVLLAIDNGHTILQRAPDCGPGLDGYRHSIEGTLYWRQW